MSSSRHERRAWQHVVGEKRRMRSEAIANFATDLLTMSTEHKEAHVVASGAKSMTNGDEIVKYLARGGSSCEVLVHSFIQR